MTEYSAERTKGPHRRPRSCVLFLVGPGFDRPASDRRGRGKFGFGTTPASAYFDLGSQLVNVSIGHQHPELVEAIVEQARRLCTIGPAMANDQRAEAARLIAELAPGHLNKVSSPTAARRRPKTPFRMARQHTGRHKVLSAYRSYHGSTKELSALPASPAVGAAEPATPRGALMGPLSSTDRRSSPKMNRRSARALCPISKRSSPTKVRPHRGDHHGARARQCWSTGAASGATCAACADL